MTAQSRPDILEVTLRDGSYLIDFQFTAEDTANIAAALERVGFRWIEIGHGLGLGASRAGKGEAAATDEQYLEAAASALTQAKWGTFFIPGIGTADDLRTAARFGMKFVRVGTNVTEVAQARPFIELGKELGLFVSYNAMKSYAVTAAEFGHVVAQVRSWGADIACLVDSAGSMFPESVSAYLGAARQQSDAPLGFHGHDNLCLVMANTLRALDEGAVLVDSSLQGMGRSAGNAITEVLVAILQQRGRLAHVDAKGAMDIGQGLIQPLLGRRGLDPMAVTGGIASFHSSFTPKVQSYARKHNIDVRDLIVRLCQEDQVSAPDDLLERISRELALQKMPQVLSIPAFGLRHQGAAHGVDAVEGLVKQIRPNAVKTGRFSAVNIVTAEQPIEQIQVSGNIQTTRAYVIGAASISTEEQLRSALQSVDGKVDLVLLDVDRKPFGPPAPARTAREILKRSTVLTYLDSRVWVEAVEDQVVRLLGEALQQVPVAIAGDHPKSRMLALRLGERGAHVTVVSRTRADGTGAAEYMKWLAPQAALDVTYLASDAPAAAAAISGAKLVAVWPGEDAWFGRTQGALVTSGAYVLDAGIGGLLPDAIEAAQQRGALLVRVNIWPALTGELSTAHESLRASRESLGWGELNGVPVVAGGAMGRHNDVIVDSVREPRRVVGVADGRGGVLFAYDAEQAERVRRVTEEINRRLVQPRTAGAGAD